MPRLIFVCFLHFPLYCLSVVSTLDMYMSSKTTRQGPFFNNFSWWACQILLIMNLWYWIKAPPLSYMYKSYLCNPINALVRPLVTFLLIVLYHFSTIFLVWGSVLPKKMPQNVSVAFYAIYGILNWLNGSHMGSVWWSVECMISQDGILSLTHPTRIQSIV